MLDIIPYDKKLHLLAGLIITLYVGMFTTPILGVTIAAIAGVVKEKYDDYTGKGTVETLDAVMTTLGGIAGVGILEIIKVVI